MKVTIYFRGPIARRIDSDSVCIDAKAGTTISEILTRLIEREDNLKGIWQNPSEIDRDSMILCNDVDIAVFGGLKMKIEEGDILTILPLVHGG